jgi:hypothetical protein
MGIHQIQSVLGAKQAFTSAWRAIETPEGYMLGGGTTPGNGVEGWSPGAIFIESDVAAAPQYNKGSKTSAIWTEIGSAATGAKFAMADDETFEAGDSTDIIQSFTSGVYFVRPLLDDTGAWNFGDGTTDLDVRVYLGSATEYATFDVGDSRFQLTNVQMGMGVQGTGIPTLTATPFAFELHAETGAVALTAGSTGLTCGLRCRYEVSVDQTNQISFEAIDARLRVKADLADGNHSGVNGTIEASESGTVLSGTGTTVRSGGFFSLDFSADVSITSGYLCGVTIDSSVHDSVSMASCSFLGLYIKKASGKEPWESGILIDGSACVEGITIGACAGHGVSVSGTFTTASSRSFKSDMTVDNPNYGDGYSANEFQLNATGTSAGHIACAGAWINMTAGTHGAGGNFICAQTNGIYETGGATITGAVVIFGMRMAHQCTDTDAGGYYAFSIVSAAGLNATTALFHTNAAAINMGAVTDAGSDDGVLVPLFQEGVSGNIGYVKIYSLS